MGDLVTGLVEAIVVDTMSTEGTIGRANTFLRQMKYKIPLAKTLGRADNYRHVLAVELAFRSENRLFNKELLQRSSNALTSKEYQQALNMCASVLRVAFNKPSAMDVLSVQFDASLRHAAFSVLDDYNRLYVSQLDPARRTHHDIQSNVYQAAAYFVASVLQKRKPQFDRRRIIEAAEVESSQFNKVEKSMMQVIVPMNKGHGQAPAKQETHGEKSEEAMIRCTDQVLLHQATQNSSHPKVESQRHQQHSSNSSINSGIAAMRPPTKRPILNLRAPNSDVAGASGSTAEGTFCPPLDLSTNIPSSSLPPLPSLARTVGAVPRLEHDRRLSSLGITADPQAQRLVDEAEAYAEKQRRKEEERASYLRTRSKIVADAKRKRETE